MWTAGCNHRPVTYDRLQGTTVRCQAPAAGGVQGTLAGMPCLVSCAVDWFAEVTVTLNGMGGWQLPPDVAKAAYALRLALAAHGLRRGRQTPAVQPLPAAAAAHRAPRCRRDDLAAGEALSNLSPAEGWRLAGGTGDGTIFPDDPVRPSGQGAFIARWRYLPSLAVVVLDPGQGRGCAGVRAADHDSIEVGARASGGVRAARSRSGPRRCLRDRGQHLSARAHGAILPSALVEESALACYSNLETLGICRAHSGTLVD